MQITEISPEVASLITVMNDMCKEETLCETSFSATGQSAYARLEEMRLEAKRMPSGVLKDQAYEAISFYSQALTNAYMRFGAARQRAQRPVEKFIDIVMALPWAGENPYKIIADHWQH